MSGGVTAVRRLSLIFDKVSQDSISGDDVKRELQALLSDSSASVRFMDELQSALGWAEIY